MAAFQKKCITHNQRLLELLEHGIYMTAGISVGLP